MKDVLYCPNCGGILKPVVKDRDWMNDDQFDSVKAGDYYCTACKGERAVSGHRYYWKRELLEKRHEHK